ncbi:2-oxoadipate dioxygenase/decarboxylase family protein [Hydrogenophaga sp.]|uniref:2-oxoadipate dioxygenase/decarboxylase HglS n=1 Tax=Hydrogenophaga sp. TaxID=1904254 RepID=UPI0027175D42|nr:DUF1338 family protein [Hydrogenophaga sp.]MDO9435704.1 DUF1338 family protein [Hydrogenophaga sp.]
MSGMAIEARADQAVPQDQIRREFAEAMSAMYQDEVPQYRELLALVADVNAASLRANPALKERLEHSGERVLLTVPRHGAIRLGSAQELHTMRRVLAVMGMQPVGYYDLSVAGVPVHSTAFRPVQDDALARNPFRLFTSLLRLDLLADPALRQEAAAILATRTIFTPTALALTAQAERDGGLGQQDAQAFVREVLQTFRWHGRTTVDAAAYARLNAAHRLLADIVCFPGPHINHLTALALDIDAAHAEMPRRAMGAKDSIEGPPPRRVPLLLRQTSFRALREPIEFLGSKDGPAASHAARFGEIEQRGVALTRQGRALYDRLLDAAQAGGPSEDASSDEGATSYPVRLARAFGAFPDDLHALHRDKLAFFRYRASGAGIAKVDALAKEGVPLDWPSVQALVERGWLHIEPLRYEDFLPVSAAGIFQSNLEGTSQGRHQPSAAKDSFEAALGCPVLDEFLLYEQASRASLTAALSDLGLAHEAQAVQETSR